MKIYFYRCRFYHNGQPRTIKTTATTAEAAREIVAAFENIPARWIKARNAGPVLKEERQLKVYRFLSYDVFGNQREGYEVNDLREPGIFIEAAEAPSVTAAVKILKRAGYFRPTVKPSKFDDPYFDDQSTEIEHRPTGRPIGRFEICDLKPGKIYPRFIKRPADLYTGGSNADVFRITPTGRITRR